MPSQIGTVLITGPSGVNVFPQLSTTIGKEGVTAIVTQATVVPASVGSVNGCLSIVYVYIQLLVLPSQSVYR